MTESDLERLIGDWYRRGSSEGDEMRWIASADCPSLARLWQHHAEGRSPAGFEGHVERCHRCRRLSEIIEREGNRSDVTASVQPQRKRWPYFVGPALAAAACLALIFVPWSQPDHDANVTLFGESAYFPSDASPTRGDGR